MAIASPAPTAAAESAILPAKPRLAYIEGLRALAALWVLLSHLWISQFSSSAHSGPFGFFSNWLLYSHLAVDVFIVLSGYCLYLPVQRESGLLKNGPMGFLKRRARRILPPLYFALAFAVVITLIVERLDGVHLQIDIRALGVNLLLMQDLILCDNVFNGPLWSVAVEWRLSLVFPLLLWCLQRRGRPFLLLTTAIIGYSLTAWMFRCRPDLLMSCPWYLLLFTMGMGAASLPSGSIHRRWLSIGALASACALALLLMRFPVTTPTTNFFGRHMSVIDPVTGVLAALLLISLRDVSHTPRAVLPKALSYPGLDALGKFSYSLYLTHEPLIRVLVRSMKFWPALAAAPLLLRFFFLVCIGMPLLIGYAYLFFVCCERPFMGTKRAPKQAQSVTLPEPAFGVGLENVTT